jgi:RNA recognition motif-containing protein
MSKGNELRVSGLSQDITEEAIRFVFSTFGKVVQVVLTEQSRNTTARRIAYISFSKR